MVGRKLLANNPLLNYFALRFHKEPPVLVLHIGTHKTGTSTLQSVLTRAAPRLAERGVSYVAAGRENRIAHHPLAWGLRGRYSTGMEVWEGARAEINASTAPIQVLSTEGFWYEDPAEVKRQLAFAGEVRIVAYLRRQDAFLQSLYKQAVSSGRKTNFQDWLSEFGYRGDYLTVIDRWADAFGRDAIVVRPYERGSSTIDVVDDFFALVGLDPADTIADIKRGSHNPSPRRELLYFLRAFNQLNLKINYDKLFYSVIGRNKAYVRSADLLTHEECVSVLARYAESNARLAERYWKGEGPLFGQPPRRDLPPMWTPEDPEFFQLAVDVLDGVVKLVAPGGPGTGAVRKKRKPQAPAP